MKLIGVVILVVLVSAALYEAKINIPLQTRKTTKLTARDGKNYPLRGNMTYWGEFFAKVGLGTPPQPLYLQIDTGSTDLVVYGATCTSCGKSVNRYDDTKSSTSATQTCADTQYICLNDGNCGGFSCTWEDQYGGGAAIKGYLDTDIFTINGWPTQSAVPVGVITEVDGLTNFEPTGVDGIWGFAFQELSGWHGHSVWYHYMMDYSLYDAFSMCLYNDGGVLGMGTDWSKDPRFKWTSIQTQNWFVVWLDDIKIGGKSLGISASDLNTDNVIVDSGTTLLIVEQEEMDAIKKLFYAYCPTTTLKGICDQKPGNTLFDGQCFQMTQQDLAMYPNITITLDGAGDLPILPVDYLWEGAGQPGYYCLGIETANLGIILGDVFMRRYHVVFDRNNQQVGFGPLSSCPKA